MEDSDACCRGMAQAPSDGIRLQRPWKLLGASERRRQPSQILSGAAVHPQEPSFGMVADYGTQSAF